jgi:integrative and conjugative element protein (TIGR02256 family)
VRETGGALLGWSEHDDVVVARVLGPGPAAKHGLRSFAPDGDWQVREGARIYAESGRTIAYLGDWHTHPRGSPTPSGQDRATAKLIADDTDFRAPSPLYAIAGHPWTEAIRRRPWRLVVYRLIEGRLVALTLRRFDLPND